MKAELIDLSETRRDLKIELPSGIVDEAIRDTAVRMGREARLPGFRPGKVPAAVVRQRFRPQIMHEVAEHLVARAVGDALTERGVEPVDSPHVRELVIEEGRPLTFTASFEVVPSFDPGDPSTLEATRPHVVVTDEEVGLAIERLRQRQARYEAVESSVVEAGHTVVVSLERQGTDRAGVQGAVDRHERVSIELGAPSNPPGFDAEMIGVSRGETRQFTLTYPADHAVAELAGGRVAYTVTLQEIKRRVVPELDDELAKDLGPFDSLEALRARVRADLEREAGASADREVRTAVMKQLAARIPFALPESLVEREVERRLEDFARQLVDQRIDPRQAGIDWVAFRDAQKGPAVDAVGSAIALDEVARREQFSVSDQEIDAELERFAKQAGVAVAAIRARLQKEGELARLSASLRREKALNWVLARARVTVGVAGRPAPAEGAS